MEGVFDLMYWITIFLLVSSHLSYLLSSRVILHVARRKMQGTGRLENLNCLVPWQKLRIIFLGLGNFNKQNLPVGKEKTHL